MLNQIDSQFLIVRPGQNMNMLRGQAKDINGWATSVNGNVAVMMHKPSAEQEEDVAKLASKAGKNVALIGGQLGLMYNVINELKKNFVVVEAITERTSEEQVQADGSTRKISIFKHLGLRVLAGG